MTDNLSNLIITNIYWVNTVFTEQGAAAKRKDRPKWAVILKHEGETEYNQRGKKITSNGTNMVILPRGCSYGWYCRQSGHYLIAEFDADFEHEDIYSFRLDSNERIIKAFKKLEFKWISNAGKTECIKLLYDIILMLLNSRRHYMPDTKKQKIQAALDFIAKNYTQNIKNDQLAALTSFSTVYFRKLFTELLGLPPTAYIHQLRINRAKEMLQSEFGSISDIAVSLGYANIYEFSRTFKKHTGLSPTNYLKFQMQNNKTEV